MGGVCERERTSVLPSKVVLQSGYINGKRKMKRSQLNMESSRKVVFCLFAVLAVLAESATAKKIREFSNNNKQFITC